jgi:hypothetical protein
MIRPEEEGGISSFWGPERAGKPKLCSPVTNEVDMGETFRQTDANVSKLDAVTAMRCSRGPGVV